jgi:RNA polymerase sigma-70 factor, ECF subfamily
MNPFTARKTKLRNYSGGLDDAPPVAATQVADTTLMAGIRNGDQGAMSVLYERHGRHVFALARRLLNDAAAAEEIVQEVFLRLWREPMRFDPERGQLRSFLFRDAHSRAIERMRSETARSKRQDRYENEPSGQLADVELEALSILRSEAVRAAVEQLSEGERDAITLSYFGGHTYREVATMLDLPEGTVKGRIRAGLTKLADHLEHMGVQA